MVNRWTGVNGEDSSIPFLTTGGLTTHQKEERRWRETLLASYTKWR